jgi:hypothetical protein
MPLLRGGEKAGHGRPAFSFLQGMSTGALLCGEKLLAVQRPSRAPSLGLGEPQTDELPVGQILDDGLHETRAVLLMIQVIRVFPDIAGPQGVHAGGHRAVRIRRRRYLELAVLQHQPCPAAAELIDRGIDELVTEVVERPEGIVQILRNVFRRLLPTVRRQGVPEKVVVPDLRGIVENLFLFAFTLRGRLDNGFKVRVLVRRAYDQLIELGHVRMMMLAVVMIDRLRRRGRRERILGEGQRLESKGHGGGSGIYVNGEERKRTRKREVPLRDLLAPDERM